MTLRTTTPAALLAATACLLTSAPAAAQSTPAPQRPVDAVQLTAPDRVDTGRVVVVTGRTSDTGTVRVLFRKRGQSAFSVRRTLTPAADGSFSTSYVADDDYRLYAQTDQGTSPVELVQAVPVLRAPATARRGDVVPVVVRAAPGTAVSVSFRGQGQSAFVVRRTGRTDSAGRYTTSYRAGGDQRYYAQERDGQRSDAVLTQLRGSRSVEVSNDPAFPGQVVVLDAPVVGSGGSRASVVLTGADGRARELGPVRTQADGSVSSEVMVPVDTASGRATLQVRGTRGTASGALYLTDQRG